MKYLCLVYHDEGRLAALPEPAYAAFLGEVREYGEILRQGGYHVAASFLQPDAAATTVRVRNGALTITDGPAAIPASTGQPGHAPQPAQPAQPGELGGFYLIDARDLNDAIRLAARMPPARYGSIEIRPVQDAGCDAGRFSTLSIDNT